MLTITALYAALCALLLVVLVLRVGLLRQRTGIGLGTGDDKYLLRRIRAHGNATETIPIVLVLMAIVELNGAPPALLHVTGTAFVVARIAHAAGLEASSGSSRGRFLGALTSLLVMAVLAAFALWQAITV